MAMRRTRGERIDLYLSADQYQAISEGATLEGKSKSTFCVDAVTYYLSRGVEEKVLSSLTSIENSQLLIREQNDVISAMLEAFMYQFLLYTPNISPDDMDDSLTFVESMRPAMMELIRGLLLNPISPSLEPEMKTKREVDDE